VCIIRRIQRLVLAKGATGEQAFNACKAGKFVQKVAPPPGPTVSSVKSAHDATRLMKSERLAEACSPKAVEVRIPE
jgi:hypothetical protein